MERIVTLIIVLIVVGFTLWVYFYNKEVNEFYSQCQASGGKVLETDSRMYCVKKDFFL